MKNNIIEDAEYTVIDNDEMSIEEVVAELASRAEQPTDEEVLAVILPQMLTDGALLIELKETKDSNIKAALILTLHEKQCPVADKPAEENTQEGVWAWNMRKGNWHYLKFSDVDAAGPFPPEPGNMGSLD